MNDPRQGWTSASSAAADALCPGRHIAQKNLPPEEQNEAAAFGTNVHSALAIENPTTLSPEERESYDSCKAIEAKLVARYFGPAILGRQPKGLREQRLWIRFDELSHSGQCDVIHRLGIRCLILEYKTLGGAVSASPRNLQLRDQCCLVWNNSVMLEEIAVAVVQPFATWDPEICVYGKDEIERSTAELYDRVVASNNPASPRIAGDVQCQFCRAKSICAEYATWAKASVPVLASSPAAAIATWTGEEIAQVLDVLGRAEEWIEQVRINAKDRLKENADAIPGWKLRSTGAAERITNPQECFNRFAALGGDLDKFMACLDVGKGKLRDAISEVTGAKGEQLDKTIESMMEGISLRVDKAPSLAKIKVKK